jgi:hypothetical protein
MVIVGRSTQQSALSIQPAQPLGAVSNGALPSKVEKSKWQLAKAKKKREPEAGSQKSE